MLALGIDIGGTNLRVARVTADGVVEASLSERIVPEPAAALAQVAALAERLAAAGVAAVGVGIPGRVDAVRQRVLSGGYLDLSRVPLAETLRARTGKPVFLDNDGNMALVAEWRAGAARGCRDVALFTIGTGIGGAILSGGAILRGRANAGQLGHLTVADDGDCACGRVGCVEATSSGTALGRLIARAGLPAATDVAHLLDAAEAGEAAAIRLLAAWAGPLRAAIDSVAATVDPELVLLGGGLGHAACRALAFAPPRSPWFGCRVAAASLGDAAGMVGAALAALAETAA